MTSSGAASCEICGAEFRSRQGLAGHRRFRHADASRAAEVDRTQAQRLATLEVLEAEEGLPPATAVLVARLKRRYGEMKGRRGPTTCVVCDAVCKTPQGLAGHMRHRHGAGATTPADRQADSLELVRFLHANRVPEPVAEAIWEKLLRLSGFRW